MADRNGKSHFGRIALLILTVYALAMIVPDVLRVVRPLGSFGLAMDGDGRIYDVRGPFEAQQDSPAWRAGLRAGDRLDLAAMRCAPVDTIVCASLLSQWGGVTYVTPGREATLVVASGTDRSGREVRLTAEPRPMNRLLDVVVVLDTIAGVLVVLGAAWLVWTRPGLMTWGFFIYVIQFNPGQAFQFWAWLQLWPRALLAQNVIFLVMQAAAYAGLLLFALRAPVDRAEGRWRTVERALPVLAIVFLGVALASMGTVFGYPAEMWARSMLLIGFAVSVGALAILIGRRRDLSPRDYQRIRWVIWGCLIGLPAYLLAQLSQQTSLFGQLLGEGQAPEEAAGALSLVNGILCLFVVEAVRRKTVVNVWIPLRRATAFGLLLSVPVLFLHKQIEVIDEYIRMPYWAWVAVASGLVYLIARGHEFATELMNRLFDRKFIRAERHLADVGETVQNSDSLDEIERLLVNEPMSTLRLASAALFREQGGIFSRSLSAGWNADHADALTSNHPLLSGRFDRKPYTPDLVDAAHASHAELPDDLERPVLVVPVGNARRCYALVLYGGHEIGTDLDSGETHLLESLARDAEIAYAQVERETLRRRIAALERQLAKTLEPR
ncbi:MAG TPA: hypothetical protein VFE60_24135 [Roseiarcus sp.]|jgi:hypothetical protein|nr:hypothetical protein [Roseiarcus sp.]